MNKFTFISSGKLPEPKSVSKKKKPTLAKDKKRKCYNCGCTGWDLQFTSDPYESEINSNDKKHWFCKDCLHDLAQEI